MIDNTVPSRIRKWYVLPIFQIHSYPALFQEVAVVSTPPVVWVFRISGVLSECPQIHLFLPRPSYANALRGQRGSGLFWIPQERAGVRLFLSPDNGQRSEEGRCFGIPGKRGPETWMKAFLDFHPLHLCSTRRFKENLEYNTAVEVKIMNATNTKEIARQSARLIRTLHKVSLYEAQTCNEIYFFFFK